MTPFTFTPDEHTRLIAAFRATRKVKELPEPTVRECLDLVHQAEQMVALCAGIEQAIQGVLMIDWCGDHLELSLPTTPDAAPLVLKLTPTRDPSSVH